MKIKKLTKEEVEKRIDRDFNLIPLSLVSKAYEEEGLSDYIMYPKTYQDSDENEEDYDEYKDIYPIHSYLFEAKEDCIVEELKNNTEKLAKIGLYLLDIEECELMIFTKGVGIDFYKHYWLPLYNQILFKD